MLDLALYFLVGIIAAFLGSISGTGGGFVAIPVLYYLGLPPHSAIAASKFMVFVNFAISIIVYLRDVKFPPKLYFSVTAPMAPMAYLGAYLVVIIPPKTPNSDRGHKPVDRKHKTALNRRGAGVGGEAWFSAAEPISLGPLPGAPPG